MLLLNDADIHRCTHLPQIIARLARDYPAASAQVPARTVIDHGHVRGFSLFMPASLPDSGILGVKVSSWFGDNPRRGLAAINGIVLLLDPDSGCLRAMLDSAGLTALRTAAMSALATDRLCPRGPISVAIVGAGVQASAHIRALAAVRPLRRVAVVSRHLARSEALAIEAGTQTGLAVEAVPGIDQALAGADVVCTVTSHDQPTPLIRADQIGPCVLINAIGGSTLEACEIDPQVLGQAEVYVDDVAAAVRESGEIRQALQRSLIAPADLLPLAQALVRTPPPAVDGIRYFRCVGHASQDMLVAQCIYEVALRDQVGSSSQYLNSSR